MKILNLGCGTKTCDRPEVTNIDWSIYLRLKRSRFLRPIVPLVIRGERLTRFNALPENTLVHDLAKGIPFGSDSVDVVYHSHLLEHLDRGAAEGFLLEVKRVLKEGGIHRIVVPDLEKLCEAYIQHLADCQANPDEPEMHDSYIAELLEQSVRKEAYGTSQQRPLRRFAENVLLGGARRRGETHQWMYDRVSLATKLEKLGYKEVHVQDYDTSLVPGWSDYGLDLDERGEQYKPGSLYVEAIK